MSSAPGFEIHPLDNLYYFRPSIPPDELDGASIFLAYAHEGMAVEGVFKLHAWHHPELPEFAAMKAIGDARKDGSPVVLTLTFDASRAALVQKVDEPDFQFRADLGELKPAQQVPEIWAAVQREFDAAIRKIDLEEQARPA